MAKALLVALNETADVQLWTHGVFDLSFAYLESLMKKVSEVDFAALILTADDLTKSRGRQKPAPRDNVIFELGLFMGKLGRHRCFFIYNEADRNIKLPSDLLGISAATYRLHANGNLVASLGSVASQIEGRISAFGCRPTLRQIVAQDESEDRPGPDISGTWSGFSPSSPNPDGVTSLNNS